MKFLFESELRVNSAQKTSRSPPNFVRTEEAAELLDISPRTAGKYWTHARTWLYHEIAVRGEKSNL